MSFWTTRPLAFPDRESHRHFHAALLFVLLTSAVLPTPAAAFDLFGDWFKSDDPADEPLAPESTPYAITVEIPGLDEDTADRLRMASQLYAEREDRPPPSTAALLSRTRGEYARLLGALYGEGYYGSAITITLNGRDPETIAADETLAKPVAVDIAIDTGKRFSFGTVSVNGRAPAPVDDGDIVDKSLDEIGLTPGAIARSTAVLGSERLLIEEWRQQGFPKASIAERQANANHPDSTLDVAITADSGPSAVYGDVTATPVAGGQMDPAFTAWMTGLKPGQPYDPDDIRRAEANLRRLEVFSSQKIVEGEEVGPDGTLPITVETAERPLHVFGGGATWSTIDGAGIDGYWQHRNLFGHAERLRFEGSVSGMNDFNPANFSYFAGTTFLKPGVFTPFTDLTASLSAARNDYDSYTELTAKADIGLSHRFSDYLSGSLGLNLEVSRIKDALGEDDYLFFSIPGQLDYDRRNNKLEPTSGYTATLKLEPFTEFNQGSVGLITELEGTSYWSLSADDSFVFATRAAVGSILGADRADIPASHLFFAGGGGSVRGYGYRNLGPRIGGEVVGGRSYVELSAEIRTRINESFGAVAFVDAGNAFAESYPDFAGGLKLGVGVGLRYYTGLGPIRLDIAVPLDAGKDDPDFGIYAGLGQAF